MFCIRDYIHVSDLAAAHIKALDYLRRGGNSTALNLGSGKGYSILEVLETARKITGKKIDAIYEPRRSGDPSRLIADPQKAFETLDWHPQSSDLETILQTAWNWQQKSAKYFF